MAGDTSNPGSAGSAPAAAPAAAGSNNIMFLFAYFLTFISGVIVFLTAQNDKRLKMHGMQAIILGILIIIIAIIGDIVMGALIASTVASAYANPYGYSYAAIASWWWVGMVFELIYFLVWLFGMYVGYKAYTGTDIEVPVVTNLARRFVG
jgi:uncharacterized membrane protein